MEVVFITLLDKNFFESSKYEELLKLYHTIPLDELPKNSMKNACTYVFTRGEHKNSVCGKPCHELACTAHVKQLEKVVKEKVAKEKVAKEKVAKEKVVPKTCISLLTSGKNKGKPCGKKCIGDAETCSSHDKKPLVKKNDKTSNKCPIIVKHGVHAGTRCCNPLENGSDSCSLHQTIRIRRSGSYFIVKNTNVLFDYDTQTIIGYKKEDAYIMEENEEVRTVCTRYDLEFIKK